MSIADKLYEARTKMHLSQQDLADKIGVSRVAVTKWEKGNTEPLGENLRRLSQFLGLSMEELYSEEPISLPDSAREVVGTSGLVPMYELGAIHAGEPIDAIEDKTLVEVPLEVATAHPEGFILRVEGHCMDRVYPDGCRVMVDPEMSPWSGCAVAALIDGGEVVMRRYYKGSGTLLLVADSASDEYEDLVFTGDMADVYTMGVIVWFQAERDIRHG